jgi:hypothetical protein
MTDKPQHSQLLTTIKWRAGARRKVSRNAIRSRIKRPQTNADDPECFKVFESSTTSRFGQDYDWHVREKAVPIGLHQSSAPVAKFDFESQEFGIDVLQKIIRSDTGMRWRQTIGIPTDHHKISDAISVCWNFSRDSKRSLLRAKKTFACRCDNGLGEPVCERVFPTTSRGMLRQISKRIIKSEFRNMRGHCGCHAPQITGFNRIASFAS